MKPETGSIKKTEWTKAYFIGTNEHNERINLSAPQWNCDWYWGFGYLGNRNLHYHLDGIGDKKNVNFYDALNKHFPQKDFLFYQREKDLWTFCELVKTAYTLRETAEVLGRGGSHYSNNPCAELIKNPEEVERINSVLLPAIFTKIEYLLQNHLELKPDPEIQQ